MEGDSDRHCSYERKPGLVARPQLFVCSGLESANWRPPSLCNHTGCEVFDLSLWYVSVSERD